MPFVFLLNLALGWTLMWFFFLAYAIWSDPTKRTHSGNDVGVTVRTRVNNNGAL